MAQISPQMRLETVEPPHRQYLQAAMRKFQAAPLLSSPDSRIERSSSRGAMGCSRNSILKQSRKLRHSAHPPVIRPHARVYGLKLIEPHKQGHEILLHIAP